MEWMEFRAFYVYIAGINALVKHADNVAEYSRLLHRLRILLYRSIGTLVESATNDEYPITVGDERTEQTNRIVWLPPHWFVIVQDKDSLLWQLRSQKIWSNVSITGNLV